jgi:hypothetical protein
MFVSQSYDPKRALDFPTSNIPFHNKIDMSSELTIAKPFVCIFPVTAYELTLT